MIAVIDAGNSRIKWGLHDGTRWLDTGVLATADVAWLSEAADEWPANAGVVICNVAGSEVAERLSSLLAQRHAAISFLHGSAAACGVRSTYERAGQLGADRWAALIGARSLHAGPAVVVMAGTATTVDALDAEGRFRGGLILPGLALMRTALAHNTADLPHAAGHYRSLPTNTDDAIVSGAIHATLGAIERMCATLGEDALCLLSGGAAGELAPHLERPLRQVDNLVLEGLARYSRTI